MLYETLGTDVNDMLTGGSVKFIVPFKLARWVQFAQVFDGLLDCGSALLRAESRLTCLLHEESFEATEHLLKVGYKKLRVASDLVD